MISCCYCNKKASIYDQKIKCVVRNCNFWIHKECSEKRSSGSNKSDSYLKNWTCKKHMAFLRTPVNNENNEISNTESVNENEHAVNNLQDEDETVNLEDETNEVISFESIDSNIELNTTQLPRSTLINNKSNNNITFRQNNFGNSSNNNENGRRAAGLFNETPKGLPRICDICKKEAKRHAYICKACDKVCHPICLLDEEEGTVDNSKETYVCNTCVTLVKTLNKATKTPINSNNNNRKQSNLNIQLNHSYGIDTSSGYIQNSHNVYNKSSFRHSNDNNMSTQRPEMDLYFIKLQYNKLPLVTDSDLTWTVFYSAFSRTKDLYDDDENVLRIQTAIRDESVKRIGGKGLFNPKTYLKCLYDVNKRLKNNISFLTSEATALENHIRIKAENKVKLVEYFDRVRNFCTMADAYNDKSYMSNKRFLANVSDVVPSFIKNKWETKQADLEDHGRNPTLKHLIEIFEKELPRLEASIRNDKIRNLEKKVENKVPVKEQLRNNRIFNINNKLHTKSSYVKEEKSDLNDKVQFTCWFHKNNDHYGNRCRALWKLDGKTVSDLAKKAKICTFCGQKQHKPCPFNSKLKCKTDGCNHQHHSLFCFKRKGFNENNSFKSNNHQKDKTESKDSEDSITNLNTKSDREKEIESMLNNLTSSNYYSNIPQEIKEYLSNYGINSNRSAHIVCNYKNSGSHSVMKSDSTILSVLVVTLENKRNCAFLLDSGSTVSLLEEKIANDLMLVGPWLPLTLTWSGDQKRKDDSSRIVKTTVSNAFNKNEYTTSYFRTVKDLKICPQKFIASEFYTEFKKFDRLRLLDYYEIVGIIGIDNPIFFEQLETIRSLSYNGSPYTGIRSPLGDYIFGTECPLKQVYIDLNSKKPCKIEQKFMAHHILTQEEQKEYEIMELEVMGLEYHAPRFNDNVIVKDKIALDLLDKKVKQDANDKHFTAPLLWDKEDIQLPTQESFKMAVRRYFIVEKEALKHNRFEESVEQIKNLLAKGYAIEMSISEALKPHRKSYYNPVFFIHPHNKRTRLIWDLAAKINGKCLNDYLMAGPNLYNDLLGILLRMREGRYLIKGDIGEMFHQIKVDYDDTNALRFLFRFSQEEKIRIFKMLVLPFGAKSSPVISQYVKNHIALKHIYKMPEAAKTILNDSYVDDIVKSTDSYETAVKLPIEIKRILKEGGFELLKINSNNSKVIEDIRNTIPKEDLEHKKLFCTDSNEKLLGYNINFTNDEISITINLSKFSEEILNSSKIPTKREVLQILMSIFDPLGLVQFLTSKFKLVYHRSCIDKKSWDEEIKQEDFNLWKKCILWLKEIHNIKIPRTYFDYSEQVCKTELWAFGDAGSEMMCGVIYIRYLNQKNLQIDVRLVYAKSFTVPVKHKRTIPQLELEVALKVSEMSQKILQTLNLNFDSIHYVTDNKAILEWIKSGAKKATAFVTKRINEINRLTEKSQWHWIPSELMPADYGTKETAMPDLNYENKWFTPDIFRLQESDWTFESNNNLTIQKCNHISNMIIKEEDNILDAYKFSNLHALIDSGRLALKWKKIINYLKLGKEVKLLESEVSKYTHNRDLKLKLKNLRESLSNLELEILDKTYQYKHVENLAIKLAQSETFHEELERLKQNKPLLKKNSLYKLLPFIDDNGVLRARSRIPYTDENVEKFGLDRIFPIILPKDHQLTILYVMKYHTENHHMMTNTVIINLMKRFHIPHIRWTVKSIIKKNCFQCRRQNTKPEIPLMGCLPMSRLDFQTHTFTHAIIDLAGPILVKNYRSRDIKRYIFVSLCLTTRAVHLELIENLTAEATLLGLQNVMNLRGSPKTIITDNGTNFIGAHAIMKEAHNTWNHALIKKGLILEPIKWQFPPAKASHMQGSVERFVGLTKKALKKMTTMINESTIKYNDFQLRSILYEIASMLNNRPLTLLPLDENTNEYLTPNHFLIGRQNIQSVPTDNININDLSEHWLDIKALTNILWKHWIKAYIPTIMMREKWVDKRSPLKINDIVIIADPTIANSWRMGRVISIKPGSEDQVRSVSIRLGKNKPLEININKRKLDENTKRKIMNNYLNETHTIVTRPATAVAKLIL